MSTNPYTPDETELRDCYALHMALAGEDYATAKADAERGIAKIKADARAEAWDEGVKAVRDWWETPDDQKYVIFNPYGTHPADRLLDDINANGDSNE